MTALASAGATAAEDAARSAHAAQIKGFLATDPRASFMLLDLGREASLFERLAGFRGRYETLLTGDLAVSAARHAPYLLQCTPGDPWLGALIEDGWGWGWFTLLWSHVEFETLLSGFRRMLQVRTVAGKKLLFRFHDPMVLGSYLPALSGPQRVRFFRGVEEYVAELGPRFSCRYRLREDLSIHVTLTEYSHGRLSPEERTLSLPALSLTGSQAAPYMVLTGEQVEAPIILNPPRLIEHIRRYLEPSFRQRMSCYPPGLLVSMLGHGCELALRLYRIRDLANICLFIDLQWRIAPGFHRQPEIHAVLTRVDSPADERFDRLGQAAYDQAWAEAAERTDSSEWFWEPAAPGRSS